MKRQLVLEDGSVFVGTAIGSMKDMDGEVVFNTGMTGYQEVLSDPSYCGQIVTFTYPLIGNYGINREDFESIVPAVHGVIVKEACDFPSNWRSEMTVDEFLTARDIPGLQGIDTRRLTRLLRTHGTLKGRICSMEQAPGEVASSLKNMAFATDQVRRVSINKPYAAPGRGKRIVLMDFGMKHGILRELTHRDCDVVVMPYNATSGDILRLHPDGVMLSNGPGDPKDVPEAVETIQGLIGKVPVFGICLGHQLTALACGANTIKLKFGHRGANHPVKDLRTGNVAITSQNHGYTVEAASLAETPLAITHIAVNDGTVEGLRHKTEAVFTVQFHPEASPGPEDANPLFDEFLAMVESNKKEGLPKCLSV